MCSLCRNSGINTELFNGQYERKLRKLRKQDGTKKHETERNKERNLYNAVTTRSPLNVTYTMRLQLEALLKAGLNKKEIAAQLGVCLATVYNEIKRGEYTYLQAVQLHGLARRTALQVRYGI